MYFVCKDNQVISPDVGRTNCWQHRKDAETIEKQNTRTNVFQWEKRTTPPVYKTEGFYLVHESLYEDIIKPHDRDAKT